MNNEYVVDPGLPAPSSDVEQAILEADPDVVATLIKVGHLPPFAKPARHPRPVPADDCDFQSLGANRLGLSPQEVADLDLPGLGEWMGTFPPLASEHGLCPDDSPASTSPAAAISATAACSTTAPTSPAPPVQPAEKHADFGPAEPLTFAGRCETKGAIDQSQVDCMLRDILRVPALFARAKLQLKYQHFDRAAEAPYHVLWKVITLIAERDEQALFDEPMKVQTLVETEAQADVANNPDDLIPELQGQLFAADKKFLGLIPWIYTSDARELNPEASCRYLKDFLQVRHVQDQLSKSFKNANAKVIVNLPSLLQHSLDEVEKIRAVDNDESVVYCGRPVDAAVLMSEPIQDNYLIADFLIAGDLLAIGGQLKSFKTSFAVDMAYAMATGTKFLGHFKVSSPRKVLLVSGETGKRGIRRLLERLTEARDAVIPPGHLFVEFLTPRLDQDGDLRLLERAIQRHKPEVVILDPFYLAVGEAEHANLFEMGSLLVKAAKKIKKAGATPVICHHVSMSSARESRREGRNLTIADLAYAGLSHAAGQWCMITTHGEGYDTNTGRGAVWLHIGSRAGHGGAYLVEIDEGSFEPGQGRAKWEVKVHAGSKAIEQANKDAQAKQQQQKSAKDFLLEEEVTQKVVTHLKSKPEGDTVNGIREACLVTSGSKPHMAIKNVVEKGKAAGWLRETKVSKVDSAGKTQHPVGVVLNWDPTVPYASHPTVAGSGL